MSIHSAGRFARKLLFAYLLLSGIGINAAILGAIYWDYYHAGKPLDLYLYDLGGRLEARSKRLVPIKNAIDIIFFRSGLLPDPKVTYARDIPYTLPRWQGAGANLLRKDTAPRYDSKGLPITLANNTCWSVYAPSKPTIKISVNSVEQLINAVRNAAPGTAILLAAGTYKLPNDLTLPIKAKTTARQPLIIRSQPGAMAIIETGSNNVLRINGNYVVLSDLILRGRCKSASCRSFLSVGQAKYLILRNLFVSGFDYVADILSQPENHFSVADGITVVGGDITNRIDGWRFAGNKILPTIDSELITVCTGTGQPRECNFSDLGKAVERAAPGSTVLIRAGTYRQAAHVKTPGLYLIGEPGTKLLEKAIGGKGAIVSDADLTVDGLECAHIKVSDGNGACVRQQKGNLTLVGVHFHHAQMGILTGHKGGIIRIYDSYIHDSGYDEDGALGHNIYVNSGELHMERTWTISARHEGHEVKSRGRITIIKDSVITSLNATDSRLIDTPNAGILEVSHSVLEEGPLSRNWDLIGYGLEMPVNAKPRFTENTITLIGNTIYSDKAGSSNMLHSRHEKSRQIKDNIMIGHMQSILGNITYDDRAAIGAPAHPSLARITP